MNKLLAASLMSCSALAADLETETFRISIESRCGEGHVTCNDVAINAHDKRGGKSVVTTGETWHTTCADGSPCRFLGYRFVDGDSTYLIHQSGLLQVVKGRDEVLLNEEGEWQ